MRVVVDTNVFVAGLLGKGGASRKVLEACLRGQLAPLMGTALYLEYEELLGRDEVWEECRLSATDREAVFDALMSVCEWTHVYYRWRPNLRDERDNHVLELAIAGGAVAIVTKNVRDFVGAELTFPDLRVMKPEPLIEEIESWPP